MTTGFLETPESEKSYGYVTCRIIRRVADTPDDADAFPNILPAEGRVVFTPKQKNVTASNYSALVLNETIEAPLNSEGYAVRYKDADTTLIALAIGTYDVRFNITSGGDIPPMTVRVTSNHTQETPLDLATVRPPAENASTTVQVISVDHSVADGSVLIKSGASVYGVPQSEFKGDPAPMPEIAWAGDVLSVDGVSSPPLSGPAPSVSWEGTSLIVGDNPPVNLRGPVGARGPAGGPGAVATASDYLIVGPGRPDMPETTGGIITGKEPVGCEYRSTDSAGVGAWVWRKQGVALGRAERWVVTSGDTGFRGINVKAVWPEYSWGAVLKLRRVNETVIVAPTTSPFTDYMRDGVTNTGEVSYELNEYGFLPNAIVITEIYDPSSADFGAKVGVARARSTMSRTTYRSITAFNLRHDALRYMSFELRWTTEDRWPTILPGYPD